MSAAGLFANRGWKAAGVAAVALLPLLPLRHLTAIFPGDWTNHQWMVTYCAEYFRSHGAFPVSYNCASAVGNAAPVFYAWLLYPLLGLLATVTGPAAAVRLAVAGLVVLQFCCVAAAIRKTSGHRGIAWVAAASVVWGTYALTNLYHRGALAEFFAMGFFVSALASGVSAWAGASAADRWFHSGRAGLLLLLTVGTHAPTALLAAGFVGLLLAANLPRLWRWCRDGSRRGGLAVAGVVLAGAVVVAPWVYANVKFAGELAVTQSVQEFIFRPENCDSVFARFAPFPFDGAAWSYGPEDTGTAYLEAPVNAVLLGFVIWNVFLLRRLRATDGDAKPVSGAAKATFVVAAGWFGFLATLSLSPAFAGAFRSLAPYVQYAYRLVSHCNAALLVALAASGAWVASRGGYGRFQRETRWMVALGAAVALLGVGIKLQHAAGMARPADFRPASAHRKLLESAHDYDVPRTVRELGAGDAARAATVAFPVSHAGADFGEVGSCSVDFKEAGWVKTNAVVFPWLEILCDGRAVPGPELSQTDQFLAVHLPAGRHELRCVETPDPVWRGLRRLSFATFGLLLAISAVWALPRWRQALTLPSARAAEPTP